MRINLFCSASPLHGLILLLAKWSEVQDGQHSILKATSDGFSAHLPTAGVVDSRPKWPAQWRRPLWTSLVFEWKMNCSRQDCIKTRWLHCLRDSLGLWPIDRCLVHYRLLRILRGFWMRNHLRKIILISLLLWQPPIRSPSDPAALEVCKLRGTWLPRPGCLKMRSWKMKS